MTPASRRSSVDPLGFLIGWGIGLLAIRALHAWQQARRDRRGVQHGN